MLLQDLDEVESESFGDMPRMIDRRAFGNLGG